MRLGLPWLKCTNCRPALARKKNRIKRKSSASRFDELKALRQSQGFQLACFAFMGTQAESSRYQTTVIEAATTGEICGRHDRLYTSSRWAQSISTRCLRAKRS